MIAYISGKIIGKKDRTITVDVNGVGYLVFVPKSLLEQINLDDKVSLHIHTHVREDMFALYGFKTDEDLAFFDLLLSVSGIGPKSALEILNEQSSRVRQAIAKRDVVFLTKIPGIGKKTAERIIVDLQGKIKEEIITEESEETSIENEDIVQALISLGYHRQRVIQGLKKIPKDITDEEAVIKYFLQNI